jgi:hypothetical protein
MGEFVDTTSLVVTEFVDTTSLVVTEFVDIIPGSVESSSSKLHTISTVLPTRKHAYFSVNRIIVERDKIYTKNRYMTAHFPGLTNVGLN